jgi:hypothetical protein
MNNNPWYELDEDNNKKDPESGLFCIRCKRKVKDTQAVTSFISVEIQGSFPTMVRKAPLTGKHLVGIDCWNKIISKK